MSVLKPKQTVTATSVEAKTPLSSSKVVLFGATIVADAFGNIIENGAIAIEHGAILFVGPAKDLPKDYLEWPTLDFNNHILAPGFINAHTHVPMGFFRGLGYGKTDMIESFLFPAEKNLTADLIGPLSYSYIVDGLRAGVTTFVDHYYFSHEIAAAFETLGVRAFVGETIADLGGAFPGRESFERAERLIQESSFSSRISFTVAPHASDTVSSSLMRDSVKLARENNLPIHMHLAQTAAETNRLLKREGKSPVAWAYELQALTENTLAVHLTNLMPGDIDYLQKSRATWGWCPASTVIYDKLAPLEELFNAGIPAALATDCPASNDTADVMAEMRLAALFLKDRHCSSHFYAPNKIYEMTTHNSAKVLGKGHELGMLCKGYKADIIAFKKSTSLLPLADIYASLVYSASSRDLTHVMIDGEWRIWQRELCSVDEEKLSSEFLAAVSEIKNRVTNFS